MRIKNFKIFLESATEKYLDADHFFYSYFINFYDEGYTFKLIKGWIDEDNIFRVITPGKNKKLGYLLQLENKENSKVDLSDSLFKAQEMIEEIEGFKVLNKSSKFFIARKDADLILESDVISDLTMEDVYKEYPFITKDMYLKSDEFIKEQLKNATIKINGDTKTWYNDKGKWLIQIHKKLKNDEFLLQYDRIWSFFRRKFNLRYYNEQTLITILLENNLKSNVISPRLCSTEKI